MNFKIMKLTPREIAKFITAILGAAAIAISQGLITGVAAKWVAVILGVATALGVYVVPNSSGSVSEIPPPAP